jgi:hypothetical protein
MALNDLFSTALQNPETTDFVALRQAYATSPEHDPYAQKGELPAARARLREAFILQDDRRIAEAGEAVLRLNPALISNHIELVAAYDRLGDGEQAGMHAHFVDGWLQALSATGDGQSLGTAFKVISLDEEYALIKASGWELVSRRVEEENGHVFDVFEARRVKDSTLAVVCFNIDLIVQSIKEGRGVLPSSGEPEVHLDVTRPGHHQLRLELSFETAETVDTVRMLTTRYLEGIGYRRGNDRRYHRGSRWGSLTSLSPRGWQAVATTEVAPKPDGVSIRAVFAVNTFGQQVTPPEEEFWWAEAAGLAKAILTGRVDTETPVAYAGRARRAGIIGMVILLVGLFLVGAVSLLIPEIFRKWLPGLTEPLAGLSSDNPILVMVFILAIVAYAVFDIWWRRRKGQSSR